MDSNLRCDEAVLASPLQTQNLMFNRGLNPSLETVDNMQQNSSYDNDEVDQTPHLVDFFIPHFIKAYQDRAILDDSRVFSIMLALEEWYIPDTDLYYCSSHQNEIKLHMRKIVADWMLDVCVDQRCQVNVFLLATNIMDRFLGTIALRKKQFQLLGAASIFLASKMVEPTPISATTLVKCTADTYDREELLSMELLILSKLKWDLTAITAYDYLDHLMAALKKCISNGEEESEDISGNVKHESQKSPLNQLLNSSSLRINAEKIILLCATDYRFANLPPSVVASAALMSSIQQEICQQQKQKQQWRSVHDKEKNSTNCCSSSTLSSTSCISNPATNQTLTSKSSFSDINLNQIVARLQILTGVQMNNLKLTINLIDQLFVIPLSTDNEKTKTYPTQSASNQNQSSSTNQTNLNSNSTAENQTQSSSSSLERITQDSGSRRSPPSSQTPSSSPVTFASSSPLSTPMEDVFMPSSPPRASSSPIPFNKGGSNPKVDSGEISSSHYRRRSSESSMTSNIMDLDTTNKDPSEGSSSTSNIEGSVTICALNESTNDKLKSENVYKDLCSSNIRDSKEHECDSKVNPDNFAGSSWNNKDLHHIQEDKNGPEKQHQCKKGDTPTEVFKVAALYVT